MFRSGGSSGNSTPRDPDSSASMGTAGSHGLLVHQGPSRSPERTYVDPCMGAATPDSISDAASFNYDQMAAAPSMYCFRPCCGGTGNDLGRTAARRAVKATLLIVAFLLAIAQWSALASGVAFFKELSGLSENNSATTTNAAFCVCFVFSIVGGVLGDAHLGSIKVLFRGLLVALFAAFTMTVLQFPVLGIAHTDGVKVTMAVLLFIFSAAAGLCQTAVPSLVGDQCWDEPQSLSSFYLMFYACLQCGAVISRVFFPYAHDAAGWFIALACFVTAPLSLALLLFALNSTVMAYKAPLPFSTAYRATRVLVSHYFLCTDRDELEATYGDDLVRESLRAAAVLKLHLPLPVFWALYFLMFSVWFIQSNQLDLCVIPGAPDVSAEQVTALNPFFDVVLLSVFGGCFWLYRRCCGAAPSAKVKIGFGYVFAIAAFTSATVVQHFINKSRAEYGTTADDIPLRRLTVWTQFPQFVLICAAEVLVYPAALHLVYIHSPVTMRSFVQSVLWFFIGIGNLVDMVVMGAASGAHLHLGNSLGLYIGYTATMAAAAVLYFFMAARYDLHAVDAPLVSPSRHFGVSGVGSSPERAAGGVGHTADVIARALNMDFHPSRSTNGEDDDASHWGRYAAPPSLHNSYQQPSGLRGTGSLVRGRGIGAAVEGTSPSKPQYLGRGPYAATSGSYTTGENQSLLHGAGGAAGLGGYTSSSVGDVERRRPISPRDHPGNSAVVYYSTRKKSPRPSQLSFNSKAQQANQQQQ